MRDAARMSASDVTDFADFAEMSAAPDDPRSAEDRMSAAEVADFADFACSAPLAVEVLADFACRSAALLVAREALAEIVAFAEVADFAEVSMSVAAVAVYIPMPDEP